MRGSTVIATLAGISFLNTMGSGILIATTPQIARHVGLSESLILWPAAVYALISGRVLAADFRRRGRCHWGPRPWTMWVTGSDLFATFTIGLGFANTGTQVIVLKTLLGIAISMCLPTAVSLITHTFPKGGGATRLLL